ncbi:MAG: tRNA (N6-isopentenyl adenosine(37)-C2)-methylthiotransferase MiaB [Erysipelotrichaceae bacterium]|nr:tRNA (N6-isopentenyl adenosine(37)-C2)-methylthiotransferase MiaB [Erysipelotrichaceae bacterium]
MAKCEFKSLPDAKLQRQRNTSFSFSYDEINISETLSNYAKGKTYYIHTYGCQANYRDEEIISGILTKAGFIKANDENADIIILNTCAVRENAEDKVFGKIGELKAIKAKNKNAIIAICGCMVQQIHIINKILDIYKHVDLIFGTHNITDLPKLLDEIILKRNKIVDVKSQPSLIEENLPSTRLSSFKAFVNISYGCDKFCTYCIVPYTRGKERSRKMEDILNECRELKEAGYQEVTLLGQNVNAYGKDFKDGTTFAKLLEEVAKLNIPRIRFLTSHPWDFKEEMIDVIAKYDNIMKYIHLPVQSGSSEILKLMGRRYTSDQYKQLVTLIRSKIKDVYLSTDIIVGFPNETEEQFQETLEMVKFAQYDSAFTFIYSPRNNTPAAKMVDNVTREEKSSRFKRLVAELEKSVSASSMAMVGKTFKVLVEGASEKDSSMLSGYTEGNKLVHFKGDLSLVGKIVDVKIIVSHTYSLIGELINA